MTIKWTKSLQNSLDQMMVNLQKTREAIRAKVSGHKQVCETEVRSESSNA